MCLPCSLADLQVIIDAKMRKNPKRIEANISESRVRDTIMLNRPCL